MTAVVAVSGREQVMANFADAFAAQDFYGRQPRTELRDAMEVFLPWLGLAGQRNGQQLQGGRLEIRRTVSQIVRGVDGWEPQGTVKADRDKYKKPIYGRLDILARLGWVESYGPVIASNGEGECVAIVLTPAGVAQSVRPAGSGAFKRTSVRGAHPPSPPLVPARRPTAGVNQRGQSRASKSEIVPPRPEGPSLGSNLPSPSSVLPNGSGRARSRKERARAERAAHVRRAAAKERARVALLIRRELRGDISDGPALVAELPWLADVHPVDLARIVVELTAGSDWPRLLISARWQRRLEVACRQIDRYANFGRGARGAAAAGIIAMAAGGWQEWTNAEPYSLGGLAVCLRRWARTWRRHDRLRSDPTFAQRSLWLAERNRHRGLDPATGAA